MRERASPWSTMVRAWTRRRATSRIRIERVARQTRNQNGLMQHSFATNIRRTRMQISNSQTDRIDSDFEKSSATDANADKPHLIPVTVVGSSAYPQIPALPSPTEIANAVITGHDTSKPVSDSLVAGPVFSLESNSIFLFGSVTNPGRYAADRRHGAGGDVGCGLRPRHRQ